MGEVGVIKLMLKPKTQSFRLKVMLSKLEAVSNKVASRCHASLRLDNEELFFKASPELKKNVAVFNAEVETENLLIRFDEVTALYEAKFATVAFELETQGTRVRIGEVQLDLAAILNEKKYRIVNSFPLAKCYDKTAKAKLSVDFVPLSAPAEQERRARDAPGVSSGREGSLREGLGGGMSGGLNGGLREAASEGAVLGGSGWKQTGYKSRLAEESNFILQEKIYEYEQKMDNYRLSQTQLQERLHEQIATKDDQIAELRGELARRTTQVSALTLEGEQLRFRLKELEGELGAAKEGSRSLVAMVEGLQHEEQDLRKQLQAARGSAEGQSRAREAKEKHYSAELAKYTQRYLESEQERNKIVFTLEAKFKDEIDRKDTNYRALIANNDKKHAENNQALRINITQLQQDLAERTETLERAVHESKKLNDLLATRGLELSEARKQLQDAQSERSSLQTRTEHLSHELETLSFSYQECEREAAALREEGAAGRRTAEQLRMELVLANQTIEEQRRGLTKFAKELQVHQERAHFLAERINDDMEIKSQQEEDLRGQSARFREDVLRLRNQLRLAQDRAEEEAAEAQQLREAVQRLQGQLAVRNQAVVRAGEQRLALQTENRGLRVQLEEVEEALLALKEENLQLGECLRERRQAQEGDKSIEWSYKIEELQGDISEMVEKFRVEKELLRDAHRKEDARRKEEVNALNALLKKANDDNQELRRICSRRDASQREHDQALEELRQALRDRTEEAAEAREKARIHAAEVEELEGRLASAEERAAGRVREAEEAHQRELKGMRRADPLKNALHRAISHLAEFLSKPLAAPAVFQELPGADLDPEITSVANMALRKFCEERTRVKETIKRLEGESFFKAEKDSRITQERRLSTETIPEPRRQLREDLLDSPWRKPRGEREREGGEEAREENQRLKREVSELRVRVRQVQEQAGRAERAAEGERYARETVRHEMEELQDELEKTAFQLRRKEKLLVEYEAEMKEMQTEILTAKSIQATTTPRPSRSEIRHREKDELAQNTKNSVAIRDLEAKLDHRARENEELGLEVARLKGELTTLNDALATQRSETKALEAKLKERSAKVAALEEQLLGARAAAEEEHQREAIRQQKRIAELEELASGLEEEGRRSQQAVAALEREAAEQERRSKQTREEARAAESKTRREQEQVQARLKESIQQLEHTILTLQSQLDQAALRNKEAATRIAALTAQLTRKAEEADTLAAALATRNGQADQAREEAEQRERELTNREVRLRERVEQLEGAVQEKEYELEEYRFTSEGRLMELEKRLEETMQLCARRA